MNENCLVGMQCPKCGSLGPFLVAVTALAEVHDDGINDYWDPEWDSSSICVCRDCDYAATVAEFSSE